MLTTAARPCVDTFTVGWFSHSGGWNLQREMRVAMKIRQQNPGHIAWERNSLPVKRAFLQMTKKKTWCGDGTYSVGRAFPTGIIATWERNNVVFGLQIIQQKTHFSVFHSVRCNFSIRLCWKIPPHGDGLCRCPHGHILWWIWWS